MNQRKIVPSVSKQRNGHCLSVYIQFLQKKNNKKHRRNLMYISGNETHTHSLTHTQGSLSRRVVSSYNCRKHRDWSVTICADAHTPYNRPIISAKLPHSNCSCNWNSFRRETVPRHIYQRTASSRGRLENSPVNTRIEHSQHKLHANRLYTSLRC